MPPLKVSMLTCELLVSRCPARVQNRVPPALATNWRRPIGPLMMGPLCWSLLLDGHRHVHLKRVQHALEVIHPRLEEGQLEVHPGAGLDGAELVLVDALGALDQADRVGVEVAVAPDPVDLLA